MEQVKSVNDKIWDYIYYGSCCIIGQYAIINGFSELWKMMGKSGQHSPVDVHRFEGCVVRTYKDGEGLYWWDVALVYDVSCKVGGMPCSVEGVPSRINALVEGIGVAGALLVDAGKL